MSDDDLLSMQETAQHLRVSMPTLYTILERRELEPSKIRQQGKQQRRFFRQGDVEALRRRRAGETV